jgi:hypothetical protein
VSPVIDEVSVVIRSRVGVNLVSTIGASECVLDIGLECGIFDWAELVRAVLPSVGRVVV